MRLVPSLSVLTSYCFEETSSRLFNRTLPRSTRRPALIISSFPAAPAQCFTYATMFSIESLAIAGESYANSDAVRRACEFLVDKQMADGGWGESYKVSWRGRARLAMLRLGAQNADGVPRDGNVQSCETEQYVHNAKSQVVNTAWGAYVLHAAASFPAKPA